MLYAVVLDTVSIQSFIFSTNNLKENLGASHLVKWIYEEPLIEALKEVTGDFNKNKYEMWMKEPEKLIIKNGASCEIGYIGGGNALIFFRDRQKAAKFVKLWTRNLLVYAPSVIPACAISEFDLDNFVESQKSLFDKLAENKRKFIPQTLIKRHGITSECKRTGYTKEIWAEKLPEEEQDYVSCVAYSKISASDLALNEVNNILKDIKYENEYCFTEKLDELGQTKGKDSHIAIVHIDGNDMSDRFRNLNNLIELRKLSTSLRKATMESFKEMLKTLLDNISIEEKIEEISIKIDSVKGLKIIPLRPIVIGGDDITFVSEGRLGIWLAKVFLEKFEEKEVSDGQRISACAGVAITKTKYPFYRGYRLSEELLKNAKKARRESENKGSWIDFQIFYGGVSGGLSQIRERQFKLGSSKILLRPYSTEDLKAVLKATWELVYNENSRLPRSKIMKLREVLYQEESEHNRFIIELESRGLKLPKYKTFYGDKIFIDQFTPYYDMIELSETYPKFALKEEANGQV